MPDDKRFLQCPGCGERIFRNDDKCMSCGADLARHRRQANAEEKAEEDRISSVDETRKETKRRRSTLPRWAWALIVLGSFLAVAVVMSYIMTAEAGHQARESERQHQEMEQWARHAPPISPTARRPAGVTLVQFNRLQTGMTYDQVVAILGNPDQLMNETQVAGYHTVMLQWWGRGEPGANVNAMFQNGRLISRAQFGLR